MTPGTLYNMHMTASMLYNIHIKHSTMYNVHVTPSTMYNVHVTPSTMYNVHVTPSTLYNVHMTPSTLYNMKYNNHFGTVCAEIFAVLNFRGCITLRIFADFIFAVVDRIKFIIFQFKMFELESFIRGFMFNMYRGRLSKERYFIALAKSRIEKIPML